MESAHLRCRALLFRMVQLGWFMWSWGRVFLGIHCYPVVRFCLGQRWNILCQTICSFLSRLLCLRQAGFSKLLLAPLWKAHIIMVCALILLLCSIQINLIAKHPCHTISSELGPLLWPGAMSALVHCRIAHQPMGQDQTCQPFFRSRAWFPAACCSQALLAYLWPASVWQGG
jgi:hypothetical protein